MLVFLFFVCTTTLSYAQHMVSGVVKDVTGEPIIGANVVEKGTTNGSITDIDGKFSFSISKPVVTLSVSYIGYQPQDYAYKGQGSVIITLKEDLQNLDEVVVVGYGVAKKRDLTGSVASVKGEKLQETASLSAVQALQGRAAGVTVMQTSAKPGEEVDLQKSVGKVDEAYKAISDIAAEGGTILFVGTKKQAQDAIATEAERCGMFYVNERWLGGMLTNFKTIQSRIARLKEIETMQEDGTFDVLPKKEVINLKKELEKLQKNLGGIKEMKKLPDAIFIVDPKKERICVQEAHALGIKLIGIADTNCDPDELDYVIPGNDDAIRAVKLIVAKMADAVIEANQGEEAAPAVEEEVAEEA